MESTKEAFAFLEHKYYFRLKTIDTHKACYESEYVQVSVYHEPLSYEIYFTIGLLTEPKLKVNTEDVWLYFSPNAEPPFFQSSEADLIQKSLSDMAQFMRTHCSSLLYGDREIYYKVLKDASKRAMGFMLKRESEQLRKELDLAWQSKDYNQVINLCQKLTSRTESEQMKLEYARKRIKAD